MVRHLSILRDLQRETGMITEFIPLLFTPGETPLANQMKSRDGSPQPAAQTVVTREPSLPLAFRMIAISRLWFYNTIRNIQTSWVKLGFETALESLRVGANDMGGTLYAENITRSAGGTNGEYVSVEQFTEAIRRAGKVPVQRDTVYRFQNSKSEIQMTKEVQSTKSQINQKLQI